MLISQEVRSPTPASHGSGPGGLAELRSQLADPLALSDGNRQRLLELASRLARIQSLGDEYVRVGLSPHARAAMPPATPGGTEPVGLA